MCFPEDDPSFREGVKMTEYEIRRYRPFGECEICGEAFFRDTERAEIVRVEDFGKGLGTDAHLIVHVHCYFNHMEEFVLA